MYFPPISWALHQAWVRTQAICTQEAPGPSWQGPVLMWTHLATTLTGSGPPLHPTPGRLCGQDPDVAGSTVPISLGPEPDPYPSSGRAPVCRWSARTSRWEEQPPSPHIAMSRTVRSHGLLQFPHSETGEEQFAAFKSPRMGAPLVAWWLRLCASAAVGVGSIPSWGTKIICCATK